jgi:enoyl-CoA hydratase/carnithine racemase
VTRSDRLVRLQLDPPLATVTLDRPDALNALTPGLLDELSDALDGASGDAGVRVIILTGEGRAFSAGVDLKALGGRSLDGGSVGDFVDVPARRVIDRLVSMPQVVIAKVNGFCFTGALELALACDVVVAADDAVFADTHAKFGLRPTWGMSQRLVRAVGITRARWLSYSAARFTGVQAAAWGLAAQAVPRAELDATVDELARTIAANSRGSLAAYKDLYRRALDVGLAEGLDYEASSAYPIDDTEARIASFR